MSNTHEADADALPHTPLAHGSRMLPAVTVDTYNEELRDDDGFVGDRASRRAFRAILADWRDRLKEHGEDPLGDTPMEDVSKAKLDKMMASEDPMIDSQNASSNSASSAGPACCRRTGLSEEAWLADPGGAVAGGIGAGAAVGSTPRVQLAPSWILAGHDAILAADIGGTNARVGVVELNADKRGSVAEADVWKRTAPTLKCIPPTSSVIPKVPSLPWRRLASRRSDHRPPEALGADNAPGNVTGLPPDPLHPLLWDHGLRDLLAPPRTSASRTGVSMAQLLGPALAGRDADLRLVRAVAIALLGAIAILGLYFGREVLIPTALAVLFAFILGPALTWVRRLLPLPLAVGVVVTGGLVVGGIVAVLVLTQLADVAGSLTRYQANLHQKIQDVRAVSEGGGAVSRFMSMVASLAHDLSLDAEPAAVTAVRVQSGMSSFASVAGFVAPLLYPLLSLGIIVILVVFILADRDHLSDQFVRLFGASDVHATSNALGDAAARVARVLALQLLTNLGFAVLVGLSLFALGMPNAVLWGLLAGALRFVPYVGAVLGAVLPTVIAFAVLPGWLMPLLVLGCIVAIDIVIGQVVEPLLFGESTGVSPLALILSAIFWGTLWGPIGLLLSTPLTICLLVMGKHVRNLGFLEILLGHEPALAPYQQIYRRLIRKAVADASAVALAEIEAKGPDAGLDEAMGRMVVLAEADGTLDRLSPPELAAIVEGTDDVLDFLSATPDDAVDAPAPLPSSLPERREDRASFRCIGGRGGIDDAAAAIFAFALRRQGFEAVVSRRGEPAGEETDDLRRVLPLICYASHPSDAVRRYNRHKLPAEQALQARHAVIDYDVAPAPSVAAGVAGPHDLWVGDIASICRLAAQHALAS